MDSILTKAQKLNLSDDDPVWAYVQMLKDFDYFEQQMIVFGHMSLKEFEETDYYRLIEVMNARPRDKRPVTMWDFAKSLDKKGGN